MKHGEIHPLVFLTLSLLLAPDLAHTQPGLTTIDTVAPGVVHKRFLLTGPKTVNVLEVSLTNPNVLLESTRPKGLVKTTLQAASIDRRGFHVVGSINADFFSYDTGWPVGNQVVNGIFAHGVASSCSHLAINSSNHAFIERLDFRGTVWSRSGKSFAITQVNDNRAANTMAFYTTFRGRSSSTDSTGSECVIRFLDPPEAGDTLRAVVTAAGQGNMNIPAAGGVLSAGKGSPAAFIASAIRVGDTIAVFLGFDRPLRSLLQVLSGRGRFLASGREVTDSMSLLEGITTKFTGVRHPRTFAGLNADTTILYLCTVDGRQASSIGMTFAEMADFMKSLGATEGFNFDGGGSTTMVVRGSIVNSPSDATGERSVANALHVISIAPLAALHFLPAAPCRREPFR